MSHSAIFPCSFYTSDLPHDRSVDEGSVIHGPRSVKEAFTASTQNEGSSTASFSANNLAVLVQHAAEEGDSTVSDADPEDAKPRKRGSFKKYWEYANDTFGSSVAGMMLKPDVTSEFANQDRREILQWLGEELKGSNVKLPVDVLLELGAGIGRFTPHLFWTARKVIAVDFIESYIAENKRCNGRARPDDVYLCADATLLQYRDETFDIVFWNWLLMYLSDDEVGPFAGRVARWLKIGGYLFFRESCGMPSNKHSRTWAVEGNPTVYRSAATYTRFFLNCSGVSFRVVFVERPVSAYQEKGPVSSQLAWLLQRIM